MKDEELINEINRIGAKYAYEIHVYFNDQIKKVPERMPFSFISYYEPSKKIYHVSADTKYEGKEYSLWAGSINLKQIKKISSIEPVFQFWMGEFKKSIDKKVELYINAHLEFLKKSGSK